MPCLKAMEDRLGWLLCSPFPQQQSLSLKKIRPWFNGPSRIKSHTTSSAALRSGKKQIHPSCFPRPSVDYWWDRQEGLFYLLLPPHCGHQHCMAFYPYRSLQSGGITILRLTDSSWVKGKKAKMILPQCFPVAVHRIQSMAATSLHDPKACPW